MVSTISSAFNIVTKMKRSTHLERLRTETFDFLIIGGGASGAGCALDSATRGYRTALIEQTDFAAATSSKSTKLIHGGVRYLEQAFMKFQFGQFAQVKHGLEERHIVLRNAPHLARPQALVTPVYSWFEGLYYTIGLTIYGWFAASKDTLPGSKWLSKAETRRRLPGLTNKLHSAVLYYDGQLDDARYCLALAQSAAEAGAAVANHTELVGFEKDENGRLQAAIVKDTLSGDTFRIEAKVFINCTGPFADSVRSMANEQLLSRIRPSKGVHAILPYGILNGEDALLIPETKDGRVVFAIPFQGQLMLGTTDEEYTAPIEEEPQLEAREVDYLLETLNRYLDIPARPEQIKAGFGGLRPLIAADPSQGTKSLVRDHEVEHDAPSNLVSLLGGKWTTYRLMAQDTIDYAEELINEKRPCTTDTHILVGGQNFRPDDWRNTQQATGLDDAAAQRLHRHYGDRIEGVLALLKEDPDLAQPLVAGHPYLAAEVIFAARHELCATVRDFLTRRIRLEILDWQAASNAAEKVAQLLAQEHQWPTGAAQGATDEYRTFLAQLQERVSK